jgi:hypothetical protein
VPAGVSALAPSNSDTPPQTASQAPQAGRPLSSCGGLRAGRPTQGERRSHQHCKCGRSRRQTTPQPPRDVGLGLAVASPMRPDAAPQRPACLRHPTRGGHHGTFNASGHWWR